MSKEEIRDSELEVFLEGLSRSQDEVSLVMLSHLYIENLLERYISANVVQTKKLFGSNGFSFNQKLNLSFSFGEFSEQEYDSIFKINSLRNNYAHKFGYEVDSKDIEGLGRTLGKVYTKIRDESESESESEYANLNNILMYICGRFARMVVGAEGKI